MRVLMVYASAHGSTAEVADFIAAAWRGCGIETVVAAVGGAPALAGYDAYVLGSAVHNSMWLPEMAHFVRRALPQLAAKPAYLWLNCLRLLERNGYAYVTKHYLPALLDPGLTFRKIGVFAGKIDLATLRMDESWTLTFRYDGRESPARLAGDHRDWKLIRAWADGVAAELGSIT
ncbi:MAG: flavodoxin [Planctomycetes bacterium]|nr:flavodoxin [Planctomycetota bacterium]